MMKPFLFACVLSTVIFSLSSCETTPSTSGETAIEPSVAAKPYPLSTCLVTGEGLESKGGSITQVYKGQEVKFCCKPCQFAFKSDPEKYLAKIQ